MGVPEQATAGRTLTRRGTAAALAGCCHPGPVAAVTALMTALAVIAGQSGGRAAVTAAAVLTGQLSVGWANDAYDAPRDLAAGRRGKPVVDGAIGVRAVWTAAFVALALCVPLSFGCGWRAGAVHVTGVAAAWGYDLWLKATVWSWLPYAVGFASLPAFVVLGTEGHPWPPWWLVAAGALLGVGAHLGDVLPDIGGDLALGVRGWPQRLGPTRARLLLPAPLVAATAALTLGPPARPGPLALTGLAAALLIALTGTVMGRKTPRAAFAAAVAVATLDVTLLLTHGSTLT